MSHTTATGDDLPGMAVNIPSVFAVVPQGWQCPVCKSVWASHVSGCENCNRPDDEQFTVADTEIVFDKFIEALSDTNEGTHET